jgi:hypothetical protein
MVLMGINQEKWKDERVCVLKDTMGIFRKKPLRSNNSSLMNKV